ALSAKVEKANRLTTGSSGWVALGTALLALAAGCGGGGMGSTGSGGGPVAGESTTVTVVVSSAANDQLSRFGMMLNTLTLTNKAGKTVSVLPAAQQVEFMHLNGSPEPLMTASVPQDVYTTATVGGASFTCLVQNQGSDTTATYAYGATPNAQVTVQMPAPVTVEGETMALSLELLVSQSATVPSTCAVNGVAQYTITPTFHLSVMPVAAAPTNSSNGPLTALEGLVGTTGASGNGFTVIPPDGTNAGTTNNWTWQVSTNSSTVFEGVGNAAGLTAGMPVDMDGVLEADGSVLATRVAVSDADTTNLTVNTGSLMFVGATVPDLFEGNRLAEGSQMYVNGWGAYDFSSATFATWGGLTNVATLPFGASFHAGNMVDGQMVSLTTHVTSVASGSGGYVPASVMTLMPQTIDGTVGAVTTAGNFTEYTVTLAPYDAFPQFAVQGGQTTLLTNPQQVVVYTDANTQMLNAAAAGVGTVLRFTGVVFNDGGTLRMDCVQVLDGVAL
ncbi:MAG TPA: DUF5666 domain-containing protein, partial [Acidobacteriaceae bacterium]|nr:DUF5666 domain-containing protein [Acidobacteriaceae bacterium]